MTSLHRLPRRPFFANLLLLRHLLSRPLPASESPVAVPRRFPFPMYSSRVLHFTSEAASPSPLVTEKAVASDYGGGGGDGPHFKGSGRVIADLSEELAAIPESDASKVVDILEAKGEFLLGNGGDEAKPMLELMFSLSTCPHIALEVFNWKRYKADNQTAILLPEEYAKAITLAGRIKNIDLAFELFTEATNKKIRTTTVYNALMTSYMFNGLNKKSLSLFEALKKDPVCQPTIITFNILLSIFGHCMMVDHMEAVMKLITDRNLVPNLSTYNNLIAGYLTAWMWDHMEKTFSAVDESSIKPNTQTYLLMLRGYAYSGNLEKMERTYEVVKTDVKEKSTNLVRAMICAYCKSSDKDRITKIEALLKLIPKDEYRPWLNVILIRVYAEEDMMERMESNIAEALEQNTRVATMSIMKAIIATYFRCNAVDKLEWFVKQAELAGWRLCRSLYHCKMVMYGCQNRLEEMENVIGEMENFNFERTKKTFWIMYKAYTSQGEIYKVNRLLGQMFKSGYELPMDANGYI